MEPFGNLTAHQKKVVKAAVRQAGRVVYNHRSKADREAVIALMRFGWIEQQIGASERGSFVHLSLTKSAMDVVASWQKEA